MNSSDGDHALDLADIENFNVQQVVENLGGISQAESISRELNSRLHQVDNEIRNHVTDHYEDLISHSTGIKSVEDVLNMMQNKSNCLSLSIHRVKSKVDDTFNKSQSKVIQLENMQNVCDTLRKVIRVLFIGRRLQQQLDSGDRDLAKSAQSVWQLDQLFSSSQDLSTIEVCIPVERLLKEASHKIKSRSAELLQKSLNDENHNTLGSVFQVYYHLNQLTLCLCGVVEDLKKKLQMDVSKLLSINELNKNQNAKSFGPGRANMPITGNSALIRSNFWSNTDKIVSLSVNSIQKFHFVISLLEKKRDSATNYVSFLELIAEEREDIVSLPSYFKFVQTLLKNEYSSCASNSSALKQIIESEYPKFLKSFLSLRDRTLSYSQLNSNSIESFSSNIFTASSVADDASATIVDSNAAESIQNGWKLCLDQFQSAYLSRSLSRMFDPVNLAFSKKEVKLPNKDEISAILGSLNSELEVVQFDKDLTGLVCKNISKTLNLFAIKAEEIVPVNSPDCWQLLTQVNETQQFMINIANVVYSFRSSVMDNLEKFTLPDSSKSNLDSSLDKLKSTVLSIVQTWLFHVQRYVKDIIQTMHKEKYELDSAASSFDKSSLYIRELSTFTARVYQSYISKFDCHSCLEEAFTTLFKSCSECLMLNIAMVCEFNDTGVRILINDIEKFEVCMKQLYPSSTYVFKSIRLFSSALKYDDKQLADIITKTDLIKPSIAILMMFSRAYPQITPPHVAADMDNSDLSKWFDEHPSEKDRIAFFNSGLEAYVQKVRNEGAKEYSNYYPQLRSMLESAFEKISNSNKL